MVVRLSTGAEHSTSATFLLLLLGDRDNVDRDRIEAHALQEVLGVRVDVQLAALGVLGEVQSRDFGDVLILALTLFFLELEGDASDGSTLDTLHQVRGVACDLYNRDTVSFLKPLLHVSRRKTHLVAKTLRRDNCNLITYALVGLEVEGELGVVPLDDDLGGLLDGLR